MPIPIRVSHNYSPLIFFAILKIPPVVRKIRKMQNLGLLETLKFGFNKFYSLNIRIWKTKTLERLKIIYPKESIV